MRPVDCPYFDPVMCRGFQPATLEGIVPYIAQQGTGMRPGPINKRRDIFGIVGNKESWAPSLPRGELCNVVP